MGGGNHRAARCRVNRNAVERYFKRGYAHMIVLPLNLLPVQFRPDRYDREVPKEGDFVRSPFPSRNKVLWQFNNANDLEVFIGKVCEVTGDSLGRKLPRPVDMAELDKELW